MAKKVTGFVKLQIPAGKANPALRWVRLSVRRGSTSWRSAKSSIARTQGQDTILPVEITIFSDKSFTFITQDAARGRCC